MQYIVAFWVTLVAAITFIAVGFFTPPKAKIDGSVLESVGFLFLWPALSFGNKALEEGKIARIRHGNTTVTVGDDPDDFDNPAPMPEDITE